jgi:hypothetical protein
MAVRFVAVSVAAILSTAAVTEAHVAHAAEPIVDVDESCVLQVRASDAALIAPSVTCSVGDLVQCPGSGGECYGNICCPGGQENQTFPCPSATPGWSECDLPAKVVNCVSTTACCKAKKAECLACSLGLTEEKFCAGSPEAEGCRKACCTEATARCMSCQNMTFEQFCALVPDMEDCDFHA